MTTPTLATVRQNYVTYADYEETGNAASCRSFITACRQLIVLLPSASTGAQQTSVEFEIAEIRQQLAAAQQWLRDNPSSTDESTNPSVIHHDFSEFTNR